MTIRLFQLFCLLFLLIFSSPSFAAVSPQQEIAHLISSYHLSGFKPSQQDLSSIDRMIAQLHDPFTHYYSNEDYKELVRSMKGHYVGVGILIGKRDSTFYVEQVYEGSAAHQAGIQAGDRITRVDDFQLTESASIESVMSKIKGARGSTVKVVVERRGGLLEYSLTREKLVIPIVQSEVLPGGVGYIRLQAFSDQSSKLFSEELKKLKGHSLQGLILDLRHNPGGLLNEVEKIAAELMTDGNLMYLKNNKGMERAVAISHGTQWTVPTVVLVDEQSASASELLAAALKERNHVKIVGYPTFGKGTVQQIFPLKSGGFLKLTIEEYLTPSKTRIDQMGIIPDIQLKAGEDPISVAQEMLKKNMK